MKHCKNCGQPIEYVATPIDNFWCHIETRLMQCHKHRPTYAEPPKHRFKIVGKFRDPMPFHQIYTDDNFIYFVVFRCVHCGSVWKVERSWLWEGQVRFDYTWIICKPNKE